MEHNLNTLLLNYLTSPNNFESNFLLGVEYEKLGQTASAISYYLRAAERTDEPLLQYECLLKSSMCFQKQGSRNFTVKGLLQHAISLMPDRPEAYYFLSRYYEEQGYDGHWNDCYMMASIGVKTVISKTPLKTIIEYPGDYGLLFQKAVSSWWCGLCDESRSMFIDLYENYNLDDSHKTVVVNNLKQLNVNIESLTEKKRAIELSTINKLSGFPSVWVVSLTESEDRREHTRTQFKQYDIDPTFRQFERFDRYTHVIQGNRLNEIDSRTFGPITSHIKMLYDWYHSNSNEEYAFFCEDDISLSIVNNWSFTWEEFVAKLPDGWDGIQLCLISQAEKPIEFRLRHIHDWGAQAYILKRDYVKRLLDSHYDTTTDTFNLNIPGQDFLPPVIEHVLFDGKGAIYNLPLFVEDIERFPSTYLEDERRYYSYNSFKRITDFWSKSGNATSLDSLMKRKGKLVDFCSFYGPYGSEMLLLRYHILKDYVDEFVVAESSYSHTGIPVEFECKKKLREWGLPENKFRVLELNTPPDSELKIELIDELNCVDGLSGEVQSQSKSKYARVRDRLSKDALLQVIDEYDDETVFMHGDIDEIVNPSFLPDLISICKDQPNGVIYLPLIYLEARGDLRVYNKHTNSPERWDWAAFICKKNVLKNATPVQLRSHKLIPSQIYTINLVNNWNQQPVIDIGWHFSWMGGKASRLTKKSSWEHRYDSFTWLLTGQYDDSNEFLSAGFKENDTPPCGNVNLILKNYPVNNLPQVIFDLPDVNKFLFPEN
jgi:tetratricopeptide (TPR) repeat protein